MCASITGSTAAATNPARHRASICRRGRRDDGGSQTKKVSPGATQTLTISILPVACFYRCEACRFEYKNSNQTVGKKAHRTSPTPGLDEYPESPDPAKL